MKALVTGGAGFIGSHVVDGLRRQGAEVLVVDSLDPQVYRRPPAYLRDDVEYCFADLRSWEPDSRFDDVEIVVHLAALGGVGRAAREPANVISANVSGTARLLASARGLTRLKRVILAGSFSIYGSNYSYRCPACGTRTNGARSATALEAGQYEVECPNCGEPALVEPITEEATPMPLETYGASKYMQELCFRGFDTAPVTILRFSSVYGPRLRLDDGEATIIAKLAGWIGSGITPTLFEDGRQIRDWVYVGDLVSAMLSLLDGAAAAPIVNVCSGQPTTLSEACAILAEVLNTTCTPTIAGGFRPGDMRHCLGEPGNFAKLLGRQPLSFAQGAPLAFGPGAVTAAAG